MNVVEDLAEVPGVVHLPAHRALNLVIGVSCDGLAGCPDIFSAGNASGHMCGPPDRGGNSRSLE